jgi:hypothetical protein
MGLVIHNRYMFHSTRLYPEFSLWRIDCDGRAITLPFLTSGSQENNRPHIESHEVREFDMHVDLFIHKLASRMQQLHPNHAMKNHLCVLD